MEDLCLSLASFCPGPPCMSHESPLQPWLPSTSGVLYYPLWPLVSGAQPPAQLMNSIPQTIRASPLTLRLSPLAPLSAPTGSKGASLIKATQDPTLPLPYSPLPD